MGITKHNWLIKDAKDIPEVIAEAFYVATTGRPGPVLVDVPKDVAQSMMEWHEPPAPEELSMPGYHPSTNVRPRGHRRGRDAARRGRATGALRRRRRAQGPRLGSAGASWSS